MGRYTFLTARTGEIVPAINELPLHSMVDPAREAQRLASTIPEDCGFVVFLGLGGGFAPIAVLAQTAAQILVIDFGKDDIQQLLSSKDYSPLLNNERFTLLTDPTNDEIKNFIITHYKPALCGGIKAIPLKTRRDADPALFEAAAQLIQEAIDIVSGDYSVQAHFGKRWFCNIIRNVRNMDTLTNSASANLFSKTVEDAAIVAAGPSLDSQIQQLFDCKKRDSFIISSDTALGALLHNGIKPNVIVSIDCQHISYYHFLGNKKPDIPLILDIASPPMLSACSAAPIFFASGHPLAHYICENWRPLPQLDTSGGNVTYACLSLAENLGARHITLFGADFAYVQGRTYAKGTYIYPFFEKKQNRFVAMEAQLSAFLYRSPFLAQETPEQKYRETSPLRFYRQKLEEKTEVDVEPGKGVPINFSFKNVPRIFSQRSQRHGDHRDFLTDYRDKIANLAITKDQQIFTTLLPYAAFLKHRNPQLKTKDLIEETKSCCINEINRIIENLLT